MRDTVIDSYLEVVEKFPEKTALLYKKGHHFERLSYEEIYKYSERLAIFLKDKGVKEGDRLVLVSENRPEWVITDIACLLLGAILVPVHYVLSGAQIKMVIEETDPKVILVSHGEVLTKILEAESLVKEKSFLVYFDNDLEADDPLVAAGKLLLFKKEVYDREYEGIIEPIKHDKKRIITIIYTSGTTGRLKGAELTNDNFISNIEAVLSLIEVTERDKFLSVLPLSHVFERTVGYYIPLLRGAAISYVEDPKKLSEIAKAERPTIIIGVPRLFEKVYQAVKDKAEASPIKKVLFAWAFRVGNEKPKDSFLYKLADRLVFHKVKAAFGGKIRFFVSGAASLQEEIGRFFDALNIPVIEGYGLTETSPIIACNTLEKRKYGTVGRILPGIDHKLTKDGELLVKGRSVFNGYYKNSEKTKEAFTYDGYFKTGDLVEIDEEGFVKFKAREKEIIALTTGKKVAPAMIEEKIELSPFIQQAFVFGDNQKHISAMIVPDSERCKGLTGAKLTEKIASEIEEFLNKEVAHYEQIKKFVVVTEPFSIENGLLTPTLKLRRKEILEKNTKAVEGIYA